MSKEKKAMAAAAGAASPSDALVQQEIEGVLDEVRIRILAYAYWEARGCPDGSPDDDWFRAEQALKNNSQG